MAIPTVLLEGGMLDPLLATQRPKRAQTHAQIQKQCFNVPVALKFAQKFENKIRGNIWHAASWPNQAVDTQTPCWTLHVSTGGHMCPRPLTTTCRRGRSLDTTRFAGHSMCPRGEQCVHEGQQIIHQPSTPCSLKQMRRGPNSIQFFENLNRFVVAKVHG